MLLYGIFSGVTSDMG